MTLLGLPGQRADADKSRAVFAPLVDYLRKRVLCLLLPMIDRIDYFHTWLVVQDRLGLPVDRNALVELIPSVLGAAQSRDRAN